MPPKAPNLKFKPKLVLREGDAASTRPPPAQGTDELSLLQLARLQGLYVESAHASTLTTTAARPGVGAGSAASTATGTSDWPGPATGVNAASTPSSSTAAGGPQHRRTAPLANEERGGGDGHAGSSLASPLPSKGRGHNLSAHAALEEASRRHVDLSLYPEVAPSLPTNSANLIVSRAASQRSIAQHTSCYAPLPLDASLPSRLNAEEPTSASELSRDPSAREARGSSAAGSPKVPLDIDGTAFLREAERELQNTYAANMRFYEEHLRPVQTGDASPSSTASSGLLWLQLPRFYGDEPFSVFDLPPGKIGELKVLRSGRMVLDIEGVFYDVAVEGDDEHAGNDGACAMAVATQPSATPSDPSAKASCYELGLIEKKLICTPVVPS